MLLLTSSHTENCNGEREGGGEQKKGRKEMEEKGKDKKQEQNQFHITLHIVEHKSTKT